MSTLPYTNSQAGIESTNAHTAIGSFGLQKTDVISKTAGKHNGIVTTVAGIISAAMLVLSPLDATAASDRPSPKHIEPDPLLLMLARHAVLQPTDTAGNNEQRFTVQCPLSYVPARYWITPAHTDSDFYVQTGEQLIDWKQVPLDRTALVSAGQIAGAGYALTLVPVGEARHSTWNFEIVLSCVSFTASSDYKLSLVGSPSTAAALSRSTQFVWCPQDYPVALGGFSNTDPSLNDAGSAPAWGTPAEPVPLRNLPDGQTDPPTGWQSTVYNRDVGQAPFVAYAICAKAPTVRAFIYSTPTLPGEPFAIFADVPDALLIAGAGADGGAYGIEGGFDAWTGDASVLSFEAWRTTNTLYAYAASSVRAYIARGIDSRVKLKPLPAMQAPGRAVAAVLAAPNDEPPPPPYTVNVIEFYNSALDHYFITANSGEIIDLDRGTHPGWARTGQSFKAFGIFSTGPIGRRPVCRAYGKPEAGLNSHFYSASYQECAATLVSFNGAWGLEASEVFQAYLPDPATGACADGGVPVYRIWNNRADSNHRYTTSMTMRDQMIAKGYVVEGYGSNGIALCALP